MSNINAIYYLVTSASSLNDEVVSKQVKSEVAQNPDIDINVLDGAGRTPLHIAAQRNMAHTLIALLDCGADPTIKSNSGKTALNDAQVRESHEVLEALSHITISITIHSCLDYQLEQWWFLEEKGNRATKGSEHYYPSEEACRRHIQQLYSVSVQKSWFQIRAGGRKYYDRNVTRIRYTEG